jgi:hypothetical protein
MGFIRHIPGTRPIEPVRHHDKTLGVGVLGLHEGRTLLLSLSTRCSDARPVAGCDLSHEKIEASKRRAARSLLHDRLRHDAETPRRRHRRDLHARCAARRAHREAGVRGRQARHLHQAARQHASTTGAGFSRRGGARGAVCWSGRSTRFFEPFRRQRAAWSAATLGTRSNWSTRTTSTAWTGTTDKSPWVATDTDWVFLGLSHPIDLVRWYLGRIERVQRDGEHLGARARARRGRAGHLHRQRF